MKSTPNAFGASPKYSIGDKVRVWAILKNPVGRVEELLDLDKREIKYRVRYTYLDGTVYDEIFEGSQLSLFELSYDLRCNCKTVSEHHTSWCNARNNISRW